MPATRPRLALIGVLALALTLAFAGAADAKKKKKSKVPGFVDVTNATPLPIPPAAGTSVGFVQSTITVPQQFRSRVIRDVNIVVQIAGTGTNSIVGLAGQVTSPGRNSTLLWGTGLGPGNLLGPITFDDESGLKPGSGTPFDPTELYAPYQGSAQPNGNPLAVMDSGAVAGNWTLTLYDFLGGAHTNVLGSWKVQATVGRPFKVK